MADVIETVQLPDQPAVAGQVRRVSLGGNGFAAPMGMYTIRNFATTGDATGGEHTHNLIMDPDYCSMVSYATVVIGTAAASRAAHWQLTGSVVPVMGENFTMTLNNSSIAGAQLLHTWLPPAFINPGTPDEVPTLQVSVLNIDTEILTLNAVIFLYNIRARESAIYEKLIGARGGMYSGKVA